jgi:hypothetical protein
VVGQLFEQRQVRLLTIAVLVEFGTDRITPMPPDSSMYLSG